jgi:hypothetical protein
MINRKGREGREEGGQGKAWRTFGSGKIMWSFGIRDTGGKT